MNNALLCVGISIFFRESVVASILGGLLSKLFTEDVKGLLSLRTAFSSYDSLSAKLFAFANSFNLSGIA